MANTAHRRGIAIRDGVALVATESTPYTPEPLASADYIVLSDIIAPPEFTIITAPADTGGMRGGFGRDRILPGASYAEARLPFFLRLPGDADDGPPPTQTAVFLAAGLSSTVVGGVSNTFAPTSDPTDWEAARLTVQIDEQGAQHTLFGGLVASLDMRFNAGGLIACNALVRGLLHSTYTTAFPNEQDPVTRSPALTYATPETRLPFTGSPLTFVMGEGAVTPEADAVTLMIANEVSVIPGGGPSAHRGYHGVLLGDRIIRAQFSYLRQLRTVQDFTESFFDDNNSGAGTTLLMTHGDGTRTLTTNLANAQATSTPTRENNNGSRYENITLRAFLDQVSLAFT